MITRAQAEALLTLAESLEACERSGVTLEGVADLVHGDNELLASLGDPISGMAVRLAVNALIPKTEQTYALNWEERP
jgi:hypothetical protein